MDDSRKALWARKITWPDCSDETLLHDAQEHCVNHQLSRALDAGVPDCLARVQTCPMRWVINYVRSEHSPYGSLVERRPELRRVLRDEADLVIAARYRGRFRCTCGRCEIAR